jgi:hypothetical protein
MAVHFEDEPGPRGMRHRASHSASRSCRSCYGQIENASLVRCVEIKICAAQTSWTRDRTRPMMEKRQKVFGWAPSTP